MYFLIYDIKVAALIAVFYMFYRLLLARESLHRLNRIVLLATAAMSFVLPLCVITIHTTELVKASVVAAAPVTGNAAMEAAPVDHWWETALPVVFWTGVAITLIMTITSIIRVCILISRCEKHPQLDGTVIAVSAASVSPFSWMRYIVVSRSDYAHPDSAILIHERAHVRLHHSADVLLVDILTSLQWFNPAMWMLRADLRAVHEYEADAAVLSSGVEARQYQYLLVRKAMAAGGYSVANGINHSTLKNRITMMQKHNSKPYGWLRAMYVIPIVAVSLIASAKTVTDYKLISGYQRAQPAANNSLARQEQLAQTKAEDGNAAVEPVVADEPDVVAAGEATAPDTVKSKPIAPVPGAMATAEVMPAFNGNVNVFIATNMMYPKVAAENGVQGLVIVRFVVNADGHVSDAAVAHSKAQFAKSDNDKATAGDVAENEKILAEGKAALEAEALRVVNSMPTWKPGTTNGKPVAVYFTVPVRFAIQ